MKRKRVIPGTCPKCGYVHGCLNDDLTEAEAQALIDRGYTVDKNVFGETIAHPHDRRGSFNSGRYEYHRIMCRPTVWERLLSV